MKDFGPFFIPPIKKMWIIPLYDSRHPEYADNIKKIRDFLIINCPYFKNPGLQQWFKTTIFPDENAIPLDLSNIEGWLNIFFNHRRTIDSDFPQRYQENSPFQTILLIQLPIIEDYWNLKKILCQKGILNQVFSKIYTANNVFGYQRWNILNSLISKIKGIPWIMDTTNPGRNSDLSLAFGFRFKRKGVEFISAIATVLSGAGHFLGYFAENFASENQLSRGMRLSTHQIENMLTNLTTEFLHNVQDKSILITRLGTFPPEEKKIFIERLQALNVQRFALVSINSDLSILM